MRAILAGLALLGAVGAAHAQQAPRRPAVPDAAALAREGLTPQGWPLPGRIGFAAVVESRLAFGCTLSLGLFSNLDTMVPTMSVLLDVARGDWREMLEFRFPPIDPKTFRVEYARTRGPCPTGTDRIRLRRLTYCSEAPDCDGSVVAARPFRHANRDQLRLEIRLD